MALNTVRILINSKFIFPVQTLLGNFRYVYLTVDILTISTLIPNKCPKFNMSKMKLLN